MGQISEYIANQLKEKNVYWYGVGWGGEKQGTAGFYKIL